MIVIKEKDAVYFASPMKYENFSACVKLDYSFEENGNIWRLNDGYGTIVMVSPRNARMVDILRYSDVFDCEFSREGMVQIFLNVKKAVKDTNCFVADGKIGADICVARGNKCYEITTFGVVLEIDDFACFSENEEMMLAANEYCKTIPDAHERIKALYNHISELSWAQYYPIAVISTKDDNYSLFYNN